jgi:hypothetical protein
VDTGNCTVNLYFAEALFGTDNPGGGGIGKQVFHVFCNGNTLLRNFDILSGSEVRTRGDLCAWLCNRNAGRRGVN